MQRSEVTFYARSLGLMFLAITFFTAIPFKAFSKETVRFCIPSADVYPFFSFDQAEISGTNPDIMRAVFAKPALQNVNLEFVQRPWKRCNVELQQGSIDFIIGSYTGARDHVAVYPNELGLDIEETVFSTADVCFISAKGEQLDRTRRGIAGENTFTVGAEAGFSQNHADNLAIDWLVIYNHLEKYRLLEKGRVDAISQVCALDGVPIATKAEVSGFKDFVTLFPPYLSSPGYIIFSQAFIDNRRELAETILREVNTIDKVSIYTQYQSGKNDAANVSNTPE